MRSPFRSRYADMLRCGVLLLAFSAACRDLDVVTESYATIEEAVAAGAVERGWVPAGLPPTARELREAHDLDSSRRWGLFDFEPADAAAMRALLGAERSVRGVTCDPPRRIEWWPLLLRGPIDEAQVGITGLVAYDARDSDLLFLVHWRQGRAYYCTKE